MRLFARVNGATDFRDRQTILTVTFDFYDFAMLNIAQAVRGGWMGTETLPNAVSGGEMGSKALPLPAIGAAWGWRAGGAPRAGMFGLPHAQAPHAGGV